MSNLTELRSRLSQAPSRLLLGIVIMLVSGFLANNLIQINDSSAVRVFVASTDLAAGQRIDAELLREATISKSVDTDQWLSEVDINTDMYLVNSLKEGEVLRKRDIALQSSNLASVSILIQRGRIPANLNIGDSVDVWDAVQPSIPLVERVYISNIEVLSGEIALTVLVPNDKVRELLMYQEFAITVPMY